MIDTSIQSIFLGPLDYFLPQGAKNSFQHTPYYSRLDIDLYKQFIAESASSCRVWWFLHKLWTWVRTPQENKTNTHFLVEIWNSFKLQNEYVERNHNKFQ